MAYSNKELLRIFGLIVSIEIIIYLAFSFCWMDLNAKNWTQNSRFGFSFLSLFVLVAIALIEIINKADK